MLITAMHFLQEEIPMPLLVTFRRFAIMMAIAGGFLGLLASTTKADSYLINNPNAGLAGSPAPYATGNLTRVTANQGSTICATAVSMSK